MATEGPNSPGTVVSDSAVGTVAWSTPGNAAASDDSYAVATLALDEHSEYLKATNFGFGITATATIDGITASIERSAAQTNRIRDEVVRLVKEGTITGDNKADTATRWPTTDASASYGGASDLWGTTWTAAQLNNSTTGIVLQAQNTDGNMSGVDGNVDHVTLTVDFTATVVAPSPIGVDATLVSPVTLKGSVVAVASLSGEATIPTLSVSAGAGFTIAPAALVVDATIPALSVGTGVSIKVITGASAVAAAIPLVTVVNGSEVAAPAMLKAGATLVAPTVGLGVTVKTNLFAAEATIPTHSVTKTVTVSPPALVVDVSFGTAQINAPDLEQICLDPNTITLSGSTLASPALVGSTIDDPQLLPC